MNVAVQKIGNTTKVETLSKVTVWIMTALALLSSSITLAEPRYQAIPVGQGYEFGAEKVMILDTESGHLWLWVESPATREESGGRYLIYQGQARPGREVGEIIGSQEWPPRK